MRFKLSITNVLSIANVLHKRHLHFGTGCQCECKSDFSSGDYFVCIWKMFITIAPWSISLAFFVYTNRGLPVYIVRDKKKSFCLLTIPTLHSNNVKCIRIKSLLSVEIFSSNFIERFLLKKKQYDNFCINVIFVKKAHNF